MQGTLSILDVELISCHLQWELRKQVITYRLFLRDYIPYPIELTSLQVKDPSAAISVEYVVSLCYERKALSV